jgi:apolipoprotein D and lipocalin family protein
MIADRKNVASKQAWTAYIIELLMKIYILFGLLLIVSAAVTSAMPKDDNPLPVVSSVDLKRYSGKWYEIARYPNRFQKSCVSDVSANYTLSDGQQLLVENECRKSNGKMETARGKARLANKNGATAKLKVRFAPSWLSWLPMVWGDYWIIDLAPDYSYSVIGTPDRKYLWILSRTRAIDETTYRDIVQKAAGLGFEPGRLVRTRQ